MTTVEWSRCARGEKRAYAARSARGARIVAAFPAEHQGGAFLAAETDGYGAYGERTLTLYKRGEDLGELRALCAAHGVPASVFPAAHLWAVKYQPASGRLGVKLYSLHDPEGLAARVPCRRLMGVGRTFGLGDTPVDVMVVTDPDWMGEWAAGRGLPCGRVRPGEHYLLHGVLFRSGQPTEVKAYSRAQPLSAILQRARELPAEAVLGGPRVL